MLYGERKTVCSEIHTRHVNTFCCKKVEFSNITQAVYTAFIQHLLGFKCKYV